MSSGKSVGKSTQWGSVLSEWKLGPKLGWRLGVLLASVILSSPGVNGDAGHLWSSLTEKGPQLMKLAQVSKWKMHTRMHTGPLYPDMASRGNVEAPEVGNESTEEES